MAAIISELPQVNLQKPIDPFTTNDKLNKLSTLLSDGDSLQFKYGDNENKEFYPLNKNGIRLLDLNFDGQSDLLYSGQSGWNNLTDTKVYYNTNGQLNFFTIISGDVLAIDKKKTEYEVFTHWTPCCDSYTSRIEKYIFSKIDSGKLSQSISYVGTNKLKGFPEFDRKKTTIVDPELFASQEDFRGTSPWFRGRNRDARDSLQNGHFISMIKLKGNISVNILDHKELNGITWHLVVTDILPNAPKSLYEWSSGKGRRFVGWINKLNE